MNGGTSDAHSAVQSVPESLPPTPITARGYFYCQVRVSHDAQASLLIFMEHKLKRKNDTASPRGPIRS